MTVTVNEPIQRTTFHIKAVHDANAEIISRIQSGDHGAFRELCEANSGLVAHVALHYLPIIERRNDIEIDDLMQAGYLGMYMAAGKYTPGRGAKFSTFAVYYIRREIQRELGFYRKRRDAADIAISLDAPLHKEGATPNTSLMLKERPDYMPRRYLYRRGKILLSC